MSHLLQHYYLIYNFASFLYNVIMLSYTNFLNLNIVKFIFNINFAIFVCLLMLKYNWQCCYQLRGLTYKHKSIRSLILKEQIVLKVRVINGTMEEGRKVERQTPREGTYSKFIKWILYLRQSLLKLLCNIKLCELTFTLANDWVKW